MELKRLLRRHSNPRSYFPFVTLFTLVLCVLVILDQTKRNLIEPGDFNEQKSQSSSSQEEPIPLAVSEVMPHADPESYVGPIVKGWAPHVDRNLSTYIRPEMNMIMNDIGCIDVERARILVFIQSDPAKSDRREANRKSWMRQRSNYPEVKVIFVFGRSEQPSARETRALAKESEENCDVIQLDFVDSYENVTLDTVFALRLALELDFGAPNGSPEFVLIADDDSYISIPRLWRKCFENEDAVERNALRTRITGNSMEELDVLTDADGAGPGEVMPALSVPAYLYSAPSYPPYVNGGGYLVPTKAIPCLYSAALRLPYLHINDAFLTGFCRAICGLEINHDATFTLEDVPVSEMKADDLVLVHKATNFKKLLLDLVKQ